MKLPLDPSHFDMPISLATCIIGAAVSALGLVAATVAGWYGQLANIDPAELAIQPRALWDLSDPNPTRGTAALFAVEEALDKSKWLRVPLEISIPIHGAAELGEVADILRPWVGHGIEQADIDRLRQMVLENRGRRLKVYEAFPPIFKLKDAWNPTGLGRTRAQMIEEALLSPE